MNILSLINESFISGVMITVIGGIILAAIIYAIKEIKRRFFIEKRKLTNEIIESLFPEKNYLKAEQLLGLPDKTYHDYSIFKDEDFDDRISYTTDLYIMDNALFKVTTSDKISIYSITVFSYDDSIVIPDIFYPYDSFSNKVTEAKICSEITDHISASTTIHTIRERSFAIQNRTGPPFYKRVTFFCDDLLENENTPNVLIGQQIYGFCLSSSEAAFYIYSNEHL